MHPSSPLEETLLFVVAQLFRIECELSSVHARVTAVRAAQLPGGVETLIHDPLERSRSATARSMACANYQEALDAVASPALRHTLRALVDAWCTDHGDPSPRR